MHRWMKEWILVKECSFPRELRTGVLEEETRRSLKEREQAVDLWARRSRQKRQGSAGGPAVGAWLVVP